MLQPACLFPPQKFAWSPNREFSPLWAKSGSLSNPEFERLLLGCLDQAYGVALKLTRRPAEAEALVQESALRALRGFGGYRPGTNFRAWYLRILTNCFYEECRRQQRRPESLEADEDLELFLFRRSGGGADPAEEFLHGLTLQQVQDAFARLPEEFRLVAALYFQQDLAYAEIAEVLELPLGTVRSRIFRARRLLQKALWEVGQGG